MDCTQDKPKRKVRAPDRYREDGTYYNGPKDPKAYFQTITTRRELKKLNARIAKELLKEITYINTASHEHAEESNTQCY